MRAIDPGATQTIICPFDKDTPPAEFVISTALSVGVRNRFMDTFMSLAGRYRDEEQVTTTELYKEYRELVRLGLRGMANVYDSTGKALVVNGSVTDEILNHLSELRISESGYDNVINWLGAEIWRANTVSDAEKKT